MKGELPQLPGELPTLDDWEQHLTTAFPEVRPLGTHFDFPWLVDQTKLWRWGT